MSDVTISTGKNLVPGGGDDGSIVNRWKQVVAVAQPTLDAVIRLREARTWLEDRQRYPTVMLDDGDFSDATDAEAASRLAIIPKMPVLQEAARLFDDAVHKAAPEPWYHLALGAMLASMPNAKNVQPEYQFMVVDTLLHDEETWEPGCEPGFSAPIFVCALRKVRKIPKEGDFVPSVAKILEACQHYRGQFRSLAQQTDVLMEVRANAAIIWFDEEQFQKWFDEERMPCIR